MTNPKTFISNSKRYRIVYVVPTQAKAKKACKVYDDYPNKITKIKKLTNGKYAVGVR